MKRIAIIGHGYVGKAVDHGFSTSQIQKILIDPVYNTTTDDLPTDAPLSAVFVCVPTPMSATGDIDTAILTDVARKLRRHNCLIIIKSTVTPDVIAALAADNPNIVYNPEFLTERNAFDDFTNPPMHVFGGAPESTRLAQELYEKHSQCNPCPVHHMTAAEAAFVKYGINTFLAAKVLWFNQFKDLAEQHGAQYNVIVGAIGADPRIGHAHTKVPGPDGKQGFGGACFPKDTKAFSLFAQNRLTVLNEVIARNNEYRRRYAPDPREQEQKVRYE